MKPQLLNVTTGALASYMFVGFNNRRHWIRSVDLLPDYGFQFPDDVVEITEKEIDSFRPAQPLPKRWTDEERATPPADVEGWQLREIAASKLFGMGIEFGALAAPFAVPIDCSVLYADLLTHKELIAHYPNESAQSMVIPSLRTRFETMEGINDESLDFVVASHVIEHTINPIEAIVKSYNALRPGGSLVLVVPDKRRTFDKLRALTSLDHLIDDFENPSHERDKQHHQEFYKLAFPSDNYENSWRWAWETKQPIHFHTWIYESFSEMVEWIKEGPAPFKSVWSHPTLPHEDHDFEFYFVMTK